MLFAGRFVDWMGTKKVFYGLSVYGRQVLVFMPFVALLQKHKLGFIVQQNWPVPQEMVVTIATVSMYCFLAARCILALGEAGNFPAAIKVTQSTSLKKTVLMLLLSLMPVHLSEH